ncbi:hypothetical protein CPT_pKp20_088 [Klebsiella phage pKp20]|jgi:hypothetical protein|nr:hypothetical protein CPT_pKp20_088 [Klebsiella phage pKp20]
MNKEFSTTRMVDAFGYPCNGYREFIHPEVENQFKEVVRNILLNAFKTQGTNPRDLGIYLEEAIREVQKSVSAKLHWAEENIAWSNKKRSDLNWPADREQIVNYAKV